MSTEIRPFRIETPEEDLVDLKRRLAATRWPDPETVDDWSQGAPLAWMQEICTYWKDTYDWRQTEARLNQRDQFLTEIDDVDIHFLHIRSPHSGALPLVLTHGWPGSIIEFDKLGDSELDLMINNRVIGQGSAVKVGENFGLRIQTIGRVDDRIRSMGG